MTTKNTPPRRRLEFEKSSTETRLTHYLFRYPAKFHPPVVRVLLAQYTAAGQTVFDPFCGSGTLLIEAAVAGRHSAGSDVDPVAVYVSRVKSRRIDPNRLEASFELVLDRLQRLRRSAEEYETRQWVDLKESEYEKARDGLWIPAIPNAEHWFRRYVLVDLARMITEIRASPVPDPDRRFMILLFASIIRASSNADPVPVSGLEVTAYMKRRDAAGRVIDPFTLWENVGRRAVRDMRSFVDAARKVRTSVRQADAASARPPIKPDAVITSPPYHGAVDYYRRHQLEMYWLGLVSSHEERLELLQRYVGRTKVAARHPLLQSRAALPERERKIEEQMREVDSARANAFRHYCVAMRRVFEQLARLLAHGSPALFVVGHSAWRSGSVTLNTSDLFDELSQPLFEISEILDYPVKNRYMSYARRNGASIDHEYVLVLRRTSKH